MFRTWLTRYPLAVFTTCALAVAGLAWPGSAAAATAVKAVSYRGYQFDVPASWPVLSLARHRDTCVRFDLHAVYLGTPGSNQHCPSWLLGTTEAIVIQPGPAAAVRESQENPVSDQITASAPGIAVTATFDTDPAAIYRVLASAGLAAPSIVVPDPARLGSAGQAAGSAGGAGDASAGTAASEQAASGARDSASADASVGYPALPASVENDVGIGFDVCAAPSSAYMRTWWRDSPYGAVGIYIGGADRACDQQNLTPGWVRQQAATGWRFIPMYAGPQASFGQLTSPASQGVSAAKDAVTEAERFGLGPRTPIYYDMEAYKPAQSGAALSFLSSWTTELHKLGYKSGVYSSSDSAVSDLARTYKSGRYVMPDAIYDALWNGSRNVADGVYKSGEWTGGRRLHQFSGDVEQTYGGDTLDIDQDYLDVSLATPGGTAQASPGVTASGAAPAVFYEGSDHRLWEDARTAAGKWRRTDLGGYLTAAPSAVHVNSATVEVFYRGSGDVLWERSRTSSGWQQARTLTQMGQIGSPHAVAQPNGVVDVFWAGTHDDHAWHAQYSPGAGWSGPQNLGGSLASAPYPVETASGQVQLFWKGTDGHLWRAVRSLARSWSAPQDLGMGKLGGAPQAVALGSGEVDVFWEGATAPHAIWSAELRPGHAAIGPQKRGGVIAGQPWPAVTAGAERIVYRSPGGRLYSIGRLASGGWATPAAVPAATGLRTAPYAAASSGTSALQVFWTSARGRLWTVRLTQPGGWHKPVDLGGRT
jgi:hypothetical protein